MKKEIEELKRLVAALGDEVRRLKAVQPMTVHYHYPHYYWPTWQPQQPWQPTPIWWSTTSGTGANQSIRIGPGSNTTTTLPFTNTFGGAG